jgi:hypothetical protein
MLQACCEHRAVGALGIPSRFGISRFINRRHQFHDTNLSGFVRSARHAIAIDERRRDFPPTLWSNLAELNKAAGSALEADNARYQQVWFPGTHSSVGGGGDRRGLSDQTLHWVWDGAMQMGLQLDSGEHSRIFELAPNYAEYLADTEEPGFFYRMMSLGGADRLPGPTHLYEVSMSARRRWHEKPENLFDQKRYRPGTLAAVSQKLDALDATKLGVGNKAREPSAEERYKMYRVRPGENLTVLAKRFYGKASDFDRIFKANLDFLEHPDRVFAGQVLRIPRTGMIEGQ